MRIIRRVAAVLSLGVALWGCSSSDSPPNNAGSGGSTGSGGSGSGGGAGAGNACKLTNCLYDYALTDEQCDSVLATACATKARAYYACSLANDSCKADGMQDGSKVFRACAMEIDAFTGCFGASDGGTD